MGKSRTASAETAEKSELRSVDPEGTPLSSSADLFDLTRSRGDAEEDAENQRWENQELRAQRQRRSPNCARLTQRVPPYPTHYVISFNRPADFTSSAGEGITRAGRPSGWGGLGRTEE